MIKGFKEFIAQGNALELAVAVIIGGAFSPIVDAITKAIMTLIGQVIGQPNFDAVGAFSLVGGFHMPTAEQVTANPDAYVMPGAILTTAINFLLVALAVYFCIVVPMNKLKELQKKAEEEAPAEPTDVELLSEIRDLLAARNS